MTRLHPTHRGAETSRPTVSQPIGGRQDSNLRTQLKFVVPLLIPEESFRPSSRRDQRKSPAKRRTGPAFGYAGGDGLPSRCIRRYRLPSRSTRQKFHARPEQGNGPAADGASFSLNSNLLECGRSRFFLPVPRQFGAWGIVPPAFITASVNCVRAEGLYVDCSGICAKLGRPPSPRPSVLVFCAQLRATYPTESRLRGWACRWDIGAGRCG